MIKRPNKIAPVRAQKNLEQMGNTPREMPTKRAITRADAPAPPNTPRPPTNLESSGAAFMNEDEEAPPDPRLLSTKNPHPHDGRVVFFDEGHWYKHVATGRRVPKSQTAATGPFFDTFDADAVVTKYFRGWRNNPESKYWALIHYLELVESKSEEDAKEAIQKLWRANGDRAASEGTKMHAQIEDYLNGLLPPPSKDVLPPMGVALLMGMLEWFYPEQQLEPWRTEFSVCVETPVDTVVKNEQVTVMMPAICGNIDAIFRSKKDGRYWILDWKRVDPKKKGLLGKQPVQLGGSKRQRSPEKALGPFSEWEASSYNKYSAQLHGYRWQLIEGYYMQPWEIAGCFLVQMHEDMQKAHVIEAADLQDEVDEVMRAEVEAANKAYRQEIRDAIAARDAEQE